MEHTYKNEEIFQTTLTCEKRLYLICHQKQLRKIFFLPLYIKFYLALLEWCHWLFLLQLPQEAVYYYDP